MGIVWNDLFADGVPVAENALRIAADLGRWDVGVLPRLAVGPKGDRLALVAEDSPSP